MMIDKDTPSTRPYLVRALYEWCTDNGLTPYVAVKVDESVQVPRDHVKNGEIVLNISFDATSALKLGNEFIEFKARFSGKAQDILVPLNRVLAIYARENGQGMAFPLDDSDSSGASTTEKNIPQSETRGDTGSKRVQLVPNDADHSDGEPQPPPRPTDRIKPSLKRIK
jgi:stringent starvation protein B